MKIIAGLGNPGAQYETTRHNVGFLLIDHLASVWGASGRTRRFDAEIYSTVCRGCHDDEKLLLVKPQTFMNDSGRSVQALVHYYQCELSSLIVIHDDLDLPPFQIRIKQGGGAGGHRGLKSIDETLGDTAYHRIRVGIGHPRTLGMTQMSPANYVLQRFSHEELQTFDSILEKFAPLAQGVLQSIHHQKAAHQQAPHERANSSTKEE